MRRGCWRRRSLRRSWPTALRMKHALESWVENDDADRDPAHEYAVLQLLEWLRYEGTYGP